LRLDIVYIDPQFPLESNYSRIYYWNQTLWAALVFKL
jgi:hypothetical protein